MLCLEAYYLGLIFATPEYFSNPKKNRYLADLSYDPFQELSPAVSMILGNVVLLKKEGNVFYDEDYSRYPKELAYQLNQTNSLSIHLAHVKPFTDCYPEEAYIYDEEEFSKDPDLAMEMIGLPYYIIHSNLTNQEALVLVDESRRDMVRFEFFRNLLSPEEYDYVFQKKKQKK